VPVAAIRRAHRSALQKIATTGAFEKGPRAVENCLSNWPDTALARALVA